MTHTPEELHEHFKAGNGTVSVSIRELRDWFTAVGPYRLRLPPIQRSLVWRNSQIVNYWDSLLRGYPAGTMMVVRSEKGPSRGVDGKTCCDNVPEYHLLDGQQRLMAMLLGFGEGPLKDTRWLWVDPEAVLPDLLLGLRINSSGQPFGYDPKDPNSKAPIKQRRAALEALGCATDAPDQIFLRFLEKEAVRLVAGKKVWALKSLLEHPDCKEASLSGDAREALKRAVQGSVTVCLCADTVLGEGDYPRFFARLGQGGTRLSDDELVYSLIKQHIPRIHDVVEKIALEQRQFVSPVNLALAAFRIAKSMPRGGTTKENDNELATRIARSTPQAVRAAGTDCRTRFEAMLNDGTDSLGKLVAQVDKQLRYRPTPAGTPVDPGLPAMLLADMPPAVMDVLLLFAHLHRDSEWETDERTALIGFVLHMLVFGNDVAGIGNTVYRVLRGRAPRETLRFDVACAGALIAAVEADGVAERAPRRDDLAVAAEAVETYTSHLCDWNTRFTTPPPVQALTGIHALRVITTHRERLRRVLMWVQRHYLHAAAEHYNPTSIHDEDLPFDLDHLIPNALFGANAQTFQAHLQSVINEDLKQRLLDHRRLFGNSLGNFRWLLFSDNRARGDDELTNVRAAPAEHGPGAAVLRTEAHENVEAFNKLIRAYNSDAKWGLLEVTRFQQVIDSRALTLLGALLDGSTLGALLQSATALAQQTAVATSG